MLFMGLNWSGLLSVCNHVCSDLMFVHVCSLSVLHPGPLNLGQSYLCVKENKRQKVSSQEPF